MARITVEDCIDKVDSRFKLIMIAAHRARMIGQGQPILVDRDNDKNTVVALREIADECVRPDDIEEQLVTSLQKHVESDEPEPNAAGLLPFDEEDADIEFDQMSETDLLKGLASMDMLGPKNADGV